MNIKTSKILSKVFKTIAIIWSCLVAITILISIIGMFISEPSFIHGWNRFTATFSPFNIANFIVTVILLLPAFGAYKLHKYFENKSISNKE